MSNTLKTISALIAALFLPLPAAAAEVTFSGRVAVWQAAQGPICEASAPQSVGAEMAMAAEGGDIRVRLTSKRWRAMEAGRAFDVAFDFGGGVISASMVSTRSADGEMSLLADAMTPTLRDALAGHDAVTVTWRGRTLARVSLKGGAAALDRLAAC